MRRKLARVFFLVEIYVDYFFRQHFRQYREYTYIFKPINCVIVNERKQPKLSIHNMYLKSRQFNYLHILCKNKIHLNACLSHAASERYEFIFVGISKHTSVPYFFFTKLDKWSCK